MIEVGVRQDNPHGPESLRPDESGQGIPLLRRPASRIHNHRLKGIVPRHGATLPELIEDKTFDM